MRTCRRHNVKGIGEFGDCPKCIEELVALRQRRENSPLNANVVDGVLTLSIGIQTLAWAAKSENGGPLVEYRVAPEKRQLWAEEVAREMMFEDGDYNGNPRAGEWLDEIMTLAANRGSGAIEEEFQKSE